MANPKKVLITTESREIFIVRINGRSNVRGFCAACAAETEMLTLDEATSRAKTTARELIRRIDAVTVHTIETASGHLLICAASLVKPSIPAAVERENFPGEEL